jgi:hypothetical protein
MPWCWVGNGNPPLPPAFLARSYDLPGNIMTDGRPVAGGKDINAHDRMLVSWICK